MQPLSGDAEKNSRELGQYSIMYSVRLANIFAASSAMMSVLSAFHNTTALSHSSQTYELS